MPFNAIGANCRAVTRWQCHSWYRPQLTLPTGCAHHENLLLPACARIFVIKSIDGFVHLLCSKIGKHARRAEQRLTISTSSMALTHPTPLFHRGSRVLITKDDLSRLGASSSSSVMPSRRAGRGEVRLNLHRHRHLLLRSRRSLSVRSKVPLTGMGLRGNFAKCT